LQLSTVFIPYGTILFSYFGFVAVPEVEQIMGRYKQDIHIAVILGIAIPMILYILFTTVVIGVAGYDMPEVATIALGQALGAEVLIIVNVFGILAMYTSALSLAVSAIHTYQEEFQFPHFSSVVVTLFPPILVVLLGLGGFFQFISFTGAVIGSLLGVAVVFMYWQAKIAGDSAPEFSLGSMRWTGVGLTTALLVGLVSTLL
jgi:amino acid transporter